MCELSPETRLKMSAAVSFSEQLREWRPQEPVGGEQQISGDMGEPCPQKVPA